MHDQRRGKVRQTSAFGLAITGMLALVVAIGIGRFAFTPILPMMQKDVGLTLRAAGVLASANYVGYLAGAVTAMWIRLSPASVVRGSALATAVLTASMGSTSGPVAWLLLRALAGVASAWMLIFASSAILQELAERNQSRLGGVMFGGVGLGIILAGLLCLAFLSLHWTAAHAWHALGGIALMLTAATWSVWRDARNPAPTPMPGAKEASASQGNARMVWAYGSFGFGYIVPATFLPAMARDVIANPAVFGWAWPLFGAAALGSVLLAGRLSTRFSFRRIWLASQLIMTAGILVPLAWSGIGGIVVSALLVGGTFVVATMAGMQEGRRVAAGSATRLLAAMTAAFAIGQIVGPLLVSATAGYAWGMNFTLAGAAAVLVVGALALRDKDKVERQEVKGKAP